MSKENARIVKDIVDAMIFTLPVVVMEATYERTRNKFIHTRTTPTDKIKYIARPGVDTVFSRIQMDLLPSPLVLTVPPSKTEAYPEGRYCTYEILDCYMDCVALVGTGFLGGDDGGVYLLCGPEYKGPTPEGVVRIDIPSNMSWISCRNLFIKEEDVEEIRTIQEKMDIRPLDESRYVERIFPDLPTKGDGALARVLAMSLPEYFNLYNYVAQENPPYVRDQEAAEKMRSYGIGAGLCFSMDQFPDGLAEELSAQAWDRVKERLYQRNDLLPKHNNWLYSAQNIARFETDYDYRGIIAYFGPAANPIEMAMYLTVSKDGDGQALNGKHRYRIRFPAGYLPPVEKMGFWSVTAYGEDQYLIGNPYDRFRISGKNPFAYHADGTLDLLIQEEAPADSEYFPNFLPCGADNFDLCLRLYLPGEKARSGEWKAPYVERLD